MAAAFFAWMTGPSASVLNAHKRQSLYMWGTIVSLGVNVVGNLILIPIVGYTGAAIATMLTELGVGAALVSFLDEKGIPAMVERALIVPPQSALGPIDPETRRALILRSPLREQYDRAIDRQSAYEILK
jgi:hypothetical protein